MKKFMMKIMVGLSMLFFVTVHASANEDGIDVVVKEFEYVVEVMLNYNNNTTTSKLLNDMLSEKVLKENGGYATGILVTQPESNHLAALFLVSELIMFDKNKLDELCPTAIQLAEIMGNIPGIDEAIVIYAFSLDQKEPSIVASSKGKCLTFEYVP